MWNDFSWPKKKLQNIWCITFWIRSPPLYYWIKHIHNICYKTVETSPLIPRITFLCSIKQYTYGRNLYITYILPEHWDEVGRLYHHCLSIICQEQFELSTFLEDIFYSILSGKSAEKRRLSLHLYNMYIKFRFR